MTEVSLLISDFDKLLHIFKAYSVNDEDYDFTSTIKSLNINSLDELNNITFHKLIKQGDGNATLTHDLDTFVDDLLVLRTIQTAMILNSSAPQVFYRVTTTEYFNHLLTQLPAADEYWDMVSNETTQYFPIQEVAIYYLQEDPLCSYKFQATHEPIPAKMPVFPLIDDTTSFLLITSPSLHHVPIVLSKTGANPPVQTPIVMGTAKPHVLFNPTSVPIPDIAACHISMPPLSNVPYAPTSVTIPPTATKQYMFAAPTSISLPPAVSKASTFLVPISLPPAPPSSFSTPKSLLIVKKETTKVVMKAINKTATKKTHGTATLAPISNTALPVLHIATPCADKTLDSCHMSSIGKIISRPWKGDFLNQLEDPTDNPTTIFLVDPPGITFIGTGSITTYMEAEQIYKSDQFIVKRTADNMNNIT